MVPISTLVASFSIMLFALATRAEKPTVRLGTVPNLRPAPRPAVGPQQVAKIKGLIAKFAELKDADFGLSPTLTGESFTPLPQLTRAHMLLLTDHKLRPSTTLKELVEIGPDAIPLLLESLDASAATKIVVRHDGNFGIMSFARELYRNPVNARETEARKWQPADPVAEFLAEGSEDKPQTSYTVTVGDACFVALGQIVGRPYHAVRYQPTACIVLNSVTNDRKFAAEVRAIWQSDDAAGTLFQSLLTDYATDGIFNGKSLDGWGRGSDFQTQAATRLLYYFPKESARLVADRLDALDVGKGKDVDDYMRRAVANRVRTEHFIPAVAWSKEPLVRAALTRVFQRTEDRRIMLAAVPGVDDTQIIRDKFEPLIRAEPADANSPYGTGHDILIALGRYTPKTARAVYEEYVRDAAAWRCISLCLVLRTVKPAWDRDLLVPMLQDTRALHEWKYQVSPARSERREYARVCDEAALTLSRNHPEFAFTLEGGHDELDRQIAAIREKLKVK
ncbi:hypothetical protein [Limnoglobus roseus]|uniref:HEAT repeat domain-containing protein n=1 Tax=Limnoglobus roseus TaxID=2598579 RepID=A0A5C1AER7_9BACT|nr:hypothetical protein [Limnoglobus roseus]QEL16693.1 HEAT repeat domain-containing protein [Limnoglobus roseus]